MGDSVDRKLTFLLIGGVFYGVGVALIKILGPFFWDSATLRALFLLINFLIAPVSLLAFAKMTGRTKHDMLVPTVIMTLAAMVMDGLTLSFIPQLYAVPPQHQAYAGGLLLVAFWSFFFFALLWHRAEGRT